MIPNMGLCDAGRDNTSSIAMSDIFNETWRDVRSYLCSTVTEQRTIGVSQDQHTNSGRKLPFVLLPSFYSHEIIWWNNTSYKGWSGCQERRFCKGSADTRLDNLHYLQLCQLTANCRLLERHTKQSHSRRRFEEPVAFIITYTPIVTQTGHNLNYCPTAVALDPFVNSPCSI